MKCRPAMINFFRINSIFFLKNLAKESAETLVLTLVVSHVGYCNTVVCRWANLS